MIRKYSVRWFLAALVICWLLPSLACNFPRENQSSTPVSGEYLRQTMRAQDVTDTTILTPAPTASEPPAADPEPDPELPTPTPIPSEMEIWPLLFLEDASQSFTYISRSGDTLEALAKRFKVSQDQISSSEAIPETTLLTPGQLLTIPNTLGDLSILDALLPDSEMIYSPTSLDFDISSYIQNAGGYLSSYSQRVREENLSGAEIIQRVAIEKSVNPRLLLAFLEFRSHWVLGFPEDNQEVDYPIGFYVPSLGGLYYELALSANHLNIGYYWWRDGKISYLTYKEGSTARISPHLNAGSVGLQNLFAKFYKPDPWRATLYGKNSFIQLYRQMFGDPWERAVIVEPILDPEIEQPTLELPFPPGEGWSFSGGPHRVLNLGSPLGALDFAPTTGGGDCSVPADWVTATAPGVVTRSDDGVVVIDLDGDGFEQTGWVMFYLHIATSERIPVGVSVETDDPIGHPSCEGGSATGSHVHIARKFNGEWIAADGPLPFVLSGWKAAAGSRVYQGTLTNGDEVVFASPGGSRSSIIER